MASLARILIVDDDPDNRELLELVLGQAGFLTLTAASGEEALVVVAEHVPDLILLDVVMFGMDGYEVAAKLKGDVTTQAIPIMMVTAMDEGRGPADDFLRKPYSRAELFLKVKNLLFLKEAALAAVTATVTVTKLTA